MSLSADTAIQILESRYDFLSARVVFKQAAEAAGLDPKGKYSDADAQKLADAIASIGDRVDAAVARIRSAGGGKAVAKAEPEKAEPPAKAEPAKAEPAKAEPAKAEPAKAEPAKAEPAKAEAEAADDADDGDDGDEKGKSGGGKRRGKK